MDIDLRYSYIIEKSLSEYDQGHYYVILAHLSTYFNDSIKKIGVSPIIEMLINICIRKLKLEIQK